LAITNRWSPATAPIGFVARRHQIGAASGRVAQLQFQISMVTDMVPSGYPYQPFFHLVCSRICCQFAPQQIALPMLTRKVRRRMT